MLKEAENIDRNDATKKAQGIQQVCTISIPTIIAALHQTALAHSNAASKKATITNSALDGDGKDAKLVSAGEHIISVVPDAAGGIIQKTDAIALLAEYVQWFVGPDLAKKVNDSTVKSLLEAPGTTKTESTIPISFRNFVLLEDADEADDGEDSDEADDEDDNDAADAADGADDDDADDTDDTDDSNDSDDSADNGDGDDDDSDGDGGSTDDGGEGEGGSNLDQSKESETGYYIAYNLAIEGMPQTALKDAMKKFAKTLFDDMKFTADGLFGGGDSFTVKDVKKAFNDVFGPIDPDDLVEKVEKEIRIQMPNTDRGDSRVVVRDKKTLLIDLGKQVNGQQRKQIESANYSLYIKVSEADPKKKVFNPRVIADIVQSSITGLFKKFKNKITKNDVIYISSYEDHTDFYASKNFRLDIDEPEKLARYFKEGEAIPSSIYTQLDSYFDKLQKNKQYGNSKLAKELVKVWQDWKAAHKNDKELQDHNKRSKDDNAEFFKDFRAKYAEVYTKYKKDESISLLRLLRTTDGMKCLLLESLYGARPHAYSSNVSRDPLKSEVMSILFEDEPAENDDVDGGEEESEGEGGESPGESTSGEGEDGSPNSGDDEESESAGDSPSSGDDDNKKYNDLYIIPMPGLRYKDKEHDSTYA